MPKYLVQVTLTAEGIKGTLQEGGTARRAVVEQLAESVGARLEALYYAFGAHDAYVIFDAPNNVAVAAASTTVAASGVGKLETIVLITPEEMDEVARTNRAAYRPPGA
jgi:uncharacterized protein with GYD domain